MFLETREYFVGYHENIAFEGDDESSRKLKFMVAFNDIFNDICGCKSLEIIWTIAAVTGGFTENIVAGRTKEIMDFNNEKCPHEKIMATVTAQ